MIDDVNEALEDGADIDCDGSAPLFAAIMANQRDIVTTLLDKGADVSIFELDVTEHEEIVEALMKLAPPEETEGGDGLEMVEVDAKMVRAFDRMIRNKGLAEPIQKKRGEEYSAFRDALKWIAAEDCYGVVMEFLEMLELAVKEGGDDGVPQFLEDDAARIKELSAAYLAASEEEVPGDLLKDYLKERKKVA